MRAPNMHGLHDVGTVGSVGSLRLRVRGTEVDAYVPIASSYTTPPRFLGEISNRPSGPVVTGRIKESLASAMWTRVDLLVIAILLLCVAFGVVGLTTSYSSGGLAPLLIGVVGTPAFALLFVKHRNQRREEWQERSATLAAQLTRYVEQG